MNTAVTSTRPRETDILENMDAYLNRATAFTEVVSTIASFLPDLLCLTKAAHERVVTARVDQTLLDEEDVKSFITTVNQARLEHRLPVLQCVRIMEYLREYHVKRRYSRERQVWEFQDLMYDLTEHSDICKANLDSGDAQECEYATSFQRGFTALQRSGLFARLYTTQFRSAIMKKSSVARVLDFDE